LSFLATEGVLFSLSGLPDFRLRADDPIRCELLIEDQKSIRFRLGATLAFIAAFWASCALGGGDPIDDGGADLGELVGSAALGQACLPIRAEVEIRAAGFLPGDVNEIADTDLATATEVRLQCLGNLMRQDAARLVRVARGGVIGGLAGFHERAKRAGIIAGERLEMGEERPEVAVIAGGDSGAAYGGHALSVTPGIEGFSIVHQASFLLAVVGFAGGHDKRLDLGWLHVAATRFR
jgi:hypothetical protein